MVKEIMRAGGPHENSSVSETAKTDCALFSGYKPCAPNKLREQRCGDCASYRPATPRILIIKTGAAGDVLRTTPILRRLRATYPLAEISWVTHYPDLISRDLVDKVFRFEWNDILLLLNQEFDLVLSLDKSPHESALGTQLRAREKRGFGIDPRGKITPLNREAQAKWLTGAFDDEMRNNRKHYVEELLEICGYEFAGESYVLDAPEPSIHFQRRPGRKAVGLNTGCGVRWKTRLWPEEHFERVGVELLRQGHDVLLLGGPDEHERNQALSRKLGAPYFGVLPIPQFLSLVNETDLVVTSVTFGLHVAIALRKRVVLLNNIFPKNEFHLYGLGEILEPELACRSCFKGTRDQYCESRDCMALITPESVLASIRRQLGPSIGAPSKPALRDARSIFEAREISAN